MKKLNVLCDLDGIIVDLLNPWLAHYNARYDDTLTIAGVTSWDLHEHVKPQCRERIYDFINNDETYGELPPIDGAIDGVREIIGAGHELTIVTAGSKNPLSAARKLDWVHDHVGLPRQSVIIAHRKELVRGDVLIDDSPPNIAKYRAAWPGAEILTIAYPYNETCASVAKRAHGYVDTRSAWKQIVQWVKEAAENAGAIPLQEVAR